MAIEAVNRIPQTYSLAPNVRWIPGKRRGSLTNLNNGVLELKESVQIQYHLEGSEVVVIPKILTHKGKGKKPTEPLWHGRGFGLRQALENLSENAVNLRVQLAEKPTSELSPEEYHTLRFLYRSLRPVA